MVASRLWWWGSAPRAAAAEETGRRRAGRATSAALMTRIRAAASSIASGRPSSRRHISDDRGGVLAVEAQVRAGGAGAVGEQHGAVDRGQRRHAARAAPPRPRAPPGSSPAPPPPAQCCTTWSSSRAAASRTCSQLSSTSSSSRPRRYSITVCSIVRPWRCCTRSATATASLTASVVVAAAPARRARRRRGSGPARARRHSTASRDLPTPPTPVSVTSGPSRRAATTRATSASRPTKLVARRGRLPHGRGGEPVAGGSVGARRRGPRRPAPGAGVARQDLLVHLPQRGSGVRAQLLAQPAAHLPVGVQRVGLPTAAELGEHELAGQALVERVVAQGHGELDEQVAVPSGRQCGVVAVQADREALGGQRRREDREPRGVDRRERLPAPERRAPGRSAPQRPRAGRPRGPRRPAAGSGAGPPTPGRSPGRSRPGRG